MNTSRLSLRVSTGTYAIGYLAAMFLPTLPEGAYPDARVSSLFGEPGERTPIIISGYLLAIAGVAFLAFASCLADAVANAGGRASARIVQVAGTAYGLVVAVAGTFFASIPMGVGLGELPRDLDPTLYRAFSNAGFYALLVPGLLAAATMVVAATIGLRGSPLVPRWCVVVGYVVAPLLLLGFAWFPQFLIALWAVAVAATLRPGGRTVEADRTLAAT